MLGTASIAFLLIFGSMTAFLAVAGLCEYVLFPVWERWKEKLTNG